MICKEKTMIYPFDVESMPLIRHSSFFKDNVFSHIISPNGWGLNGKDASYDEGGQETGLIVDSDFDKALKECETIFFTKSNRQIDFNRSIYPKLKKSAELSKNIICSIELKKEQIEEISKVCKMNGKYFKYLSHPYKDIVCPKTEKIYKINTPVVFVTGLGERTHKFEIQLSLRDSLQQMGYKVSQIGTRNYCELMGFNSFPGFMYSRNITESEKVILFNHYIKNIEVNENPDIIIIGVPGGTMPFNYEFTNKFGILAYEISQAIIPDFVVFGTLYENVTTEFFELISKSHKYKFGYDIDCYNISNTSLNVQGSRNESSLQYLTMDWEFINDKKEEYRSLDMPIYNILDKNDIKNITEFMIDNLSEYINTEAV